MVKFKPGDVVVRNDKSYFCLLLITSVELEHESRLHGAYHYRRLAYRKLTNTELGNVGLTWDRIGHIDAYYSKSDEWGEFVKENLNVFELLYG